MNTQTIPSKPQGLPPSQEYFESQTLSLPSFKLDPSSQSNQSILPTYLLTHLPLHRFSTHLNPCTLILYYLHTYLHAEMDPGSEGSRPCHTIGRKSHHIHHAYPLHTHIHEAMQERSQETPTTFSFSHSLKKAEKYKTRHEPFIHSMYQSHHHPFLLTFTNLI